MTLGHHTQLPKRPPIVGHVVRFDTMGPTILHPVSCSVVIEKAVDCPHWQALNAGRVVGIPTHGLHVGVLRGDMLHLLPNNHATRARAEVASEFDTLHRAWMKETRT